MKGVGMMIETEILAIIAAIGGFIVGYIVGASTTKMGRVVYVEKGETRPSMRTDRDIGISIFGGGRGVGIGAPPPRPPQRRDDD